ncbi:hypothetical protein GCM10011487_32700 [Steroidobacter agaridevorans]|uniref:Uncharacterized protein n=1 Tax=Steroidobacter agaridevorans TaxID=2695856 RepID=A0A829YDF0_9GAMM|nr:hypothetical protein [Steroidobacter agaridevorans]GFE81270.1 hypothetical protein GCM10011487_32700 [Steroidobacter agaridevorans]GFE88846.1 hypothetical protein GCM10011488_38000 [Steroidobacter agaridevorans]
MTTTETKIDEMTATGRHRAWAGESAGAIVRAGTGTPPREPQRANWLDRAPTAASNSRHAAITRSLHTWSNYKSWTDKVKSSWDKDTKSGK